MIGLDLQGSSDERPALVSHLEKDGRAICGTRMFTFWSGCWDDQPTCLRCQKIAASKAKRVAAKAKAKP